MSNDFSDRMNAQRAILKLVNQVEWPREELFALSADAIKRWLSVNRLGDDSEIIELVREAGDRLLFLANASQEQITMEYTYRTANVAAIHDRLRSLIESDSHYRAPIKTHEQR